MSKSRIDALDMEKIIARLMNKFEDWDNDSEDIDDISIDFYQKYGVAAEQAAEIIQDFWSLLTLERSLLTGMPTIGIKEPSAPFWIIYKQNEK